MQAGHYSSLLPELFRHKSTKVRLFKPQIILLDFHGTISERRWEDKIIFPYVKRSICQYVRDNFATEPVQRCVPGLRNESFEQRFRHKYEDAPIIEDQTEAMSDRDEDHQQHQQQVADQVGEFLLWQMQTKRETRETQLMERLVWQDAFRRKLLTTPVYDDTLVCMQDWRERHNISLYVISSIDCETLKLLFENTDRGNLSQFVSGYVCSKKPGDKLMSETYKQFYDKTQAHSKAKNKTPPPPPVNLETNGRNKLVNSKSPPRGPISGSGSSSGSEISLSSTAKPILFLTDSGQEAKAASLAVDATGYDCLLVNRPGNKRIRTYYLSQFQYIERFDDIEFIQQ